jgi:hypothetical protein
MKLANCKLQIAQGALPSRLRRRPRRRQFSIFNFQFSFCNSPYVAMLLAVLLVPASAARSADDASLRRRQDAQERARQMARQLVTGILEIQLQQLEENGLKELPLYREIAGMKRNIAALVDQEMEQAVSLLVDAQRGSPQEREQAFKQARKMIREIVMRLSAERQSLMRRLKSAALTAQVKAVIDLESKVWQATKTLPDQPPAKQESVALAAIEDQGDVKQLFLQLAEALSEVSQWGGPLGAGAADGLRILQTAAVHRELDVAGNMLDALRYADAARSQQLVLKGLRLLQEKLDDAQGLLGADRQSALALARGLIERQEKLREQTRAADLAQPEAERLVEEQAAVRKDMNRLGQAIGTLPAADPLLETAKAAAYEATGRLFDARQDEALAEQGKVLGNLEEIARQLASAAEARQSEKSSAELAREVNDLEQAKADIDRIRKQQSEVDREATENAAQAGRQEQAVSRALGKVDDNRHLPKEVESRLASAEAASRDAAGALEKGPAKGADARQRDALESADRAIERAAAEIEAALDDARRNESGVKIGELGRAAEALERTAAAERDIARAAGRAADNAGLDADSAGKLGERQADIERIATKVAEGIEGLAGDAALLARSGAKDAARAREQFARAAGREGPASKPDAGEAGKSSAEAAAKLAQAAARVRQEIEQAAAALASESSRQLEKVSPVREAVDQALAGAEAPLTERIDRLARADRQVGAALTAQERAAGRPAVADAMQLADAIRDAQAEQAQADLAAQQAAEGASSSPLEAITREQSVADQSAKIAETAGRRPQARDARAAGKIDPLTESAQHAARAATRAARAALDGNASDAAAARAEAGQALAEAAEMAAREAQAASSGPRGTPDASAQKQVGEAIANAAKLAGDDVPQATPPLASAGKSSAEAQRQAQSGSPEQAAAAQKQTAAALAAARDELRAALKKLARDRAGQLARQAREAEALAGRAAPADPGALSALRDAQARAARSADAAADNSPQAALAQSQSRRDVERAAASLNAREQRIERDRAIAQAVRRMATDQQEAADEIARQSAHLRSAKENGDDKDDSPQAGAGDRDEQGNSGDEQSAGQERSPKAAQRRQAAERLTEAQRNFADAQRGTGEAAEELANQSQVANPPLRQAMKLVSSLPSGEGQGPKGSLGSGSENPNSNAQGSELGTGFIPNSPEATAAMMAGAEATSRAAAELGGQGSSKPGGKGSDGGEEGEGFPDPDGATSDSAGKDGAGEGSGKAPDGQQSKASGQSRAGPQQGGRGNSKGAQDRMNQQQNQGMSSSGPGSQVGPGGTSGSRDADVASRDLSHESWFTKLPPELRKAIRAKAQRPPPRSYEEKLQKYFESLD